MFENKKQLFDCETCLFRSIRWHFLLKNQAEVCLADIIRYFEEKIAMIYCVSEKAKKQ
jgi:hypothetical protein